MDKIRPIKMEDDSPKKKIGFVKKALSALRSFIFIVFGFLLAFFCFVVYYLSSNLDMVLKLTNAEEMRAMYKSCKVEKVYVKK